MTPRRILASAAIAGLAALCQCSVFFDLGGLDTGDGGWIDAGDLAAADDGGRDPGALDAADDGEGAAGGFDAADGGVRDARGLDAEGGRDSAGRADSADGGTGGLDAADSAVDGAGGLDAADSAGGLDAADSAMDGTGGSDAADGGGILAGLVAFYPFNETSGTSCADASGNNRTATMQGATFANGLTGNAATMDGTNQYVTLPNGIVSGLTSFSIATWVYLSASPMWSRIFDIGTGTNTYMFLTPNSRTGTLRFSITTGGYNTEQQLNAPVLPTGSWQHVAVTLTGNTGTLYVNGVQVAQNAGMTLNPASLGTTTQSWLGRSQYAVDPYLSGQIDNFRLYNRALTAPEVQQLFQQKQ